jgi:hypothetical protein
MSMKDGGCSTEEGTMVRGAWSSITLACVVGGAHQWSFDEAAQTYAS